MTIEQSASGGAFVGLVQGKRLQKIVGRRWNIALGQALEEPERPLGPLVQNRGGGRETKDVWIAGAGVQRLFSERKESGRAHCIVEGVNQLTYPMLDRRFKRKQCLMWRRHSGVANRTMARVYPGFYVLGREPVSEDNGELGFCGYRPACGTFHCLEDPCKAGNSSFDPFSRSN